MYDEPVDCLEIYLRAIRDPTPELQESFEAEIALILSLISPESTVLDLGCGAGRVMKMLAKNLEKITGIDSDERIVTIAREECADLENVQILIGDALSLPFEDAAFDLTFSTMNTIGTFPGAQQSIIVKEMSRVTKPGGYVINTTWRTDEEALEAIRRYYEQYYQDAAFAILAMDASKTVTTKGTFERLNQETLRKLYEGAGIQDIVFQTLGPLFFGAIGTI